MAITFIQLWATYVVDIRCLNNFCHTFQLNLEACAWEFDYYARPCRQMWKVLMVYFIHNFRVLLVGNKEQYFHNFIQIGTRFFKNGLHIFDSQGSLFGGGFSNYPITSDTNAS